MADFRCQGCGRRVPQPPPPASNVICARCGEAMRPTLTLPVHHPMKLLFGAALLFCAIYFYMQIDWQGLAQGIDWDTLLRGSDGNAAAGR